VGRPKQYEEDRVTTAVRVPTPVHEKFRALAEERDVSVNYLINKAMTRYLDDQLAMAVASR
jgi:predicted HicB family RNase H-like nuclease